MVAQNKIEIGMQFDLLKVFVLHWQKLKNVEKSFFSSQVQNVIWAIVPILDGNSEIVAHLRSNLSYLIC